ncbi:hypothetical protein P9027_22715 [Bacillus thuringiensis]|uniref:hypothetical protein n=1 Tax=Bacillus thuringiensis TaxID=1428 RepID=UPI002DBDED62|nr:hypothetical protein [Bacillus thuringiensis]MEC3224801.1 hypothetical protein [Bacillus thuringiensis]MEC3462588.1 hypothetical protein [Bacillus thuringiensis]MEC3554960.1 hypothetical protein [Bacillus thuringiensis]MED2058303.1 hypothetical protein [Bacillus thuringiensis]
MRKQENAISEALNVDSVEVKKPVIKKVLPMVRDEEEIKLINDKPHKKVFKFGKELFLELDWEQVPKHRLAELKTQKNM